MLLNKAKSNNNVYNNSNNKYAFHLNQIQLNIIKNKHLTNISHSFLINQKYNQNNDYYRNYLFYNNNCEGC